MKILFGVSLIAILAAAGLAYNTRSKLVEARAERDSINKNTLSIHDSVRNKDRDTSAKWAEWEANQKSAKDELLTKKSLDTDIKGEKTKLDDINKRIEEIKAERAAMQKKIDDAIGEAGGDLDQLADRVKALEGETDALTQEIASLNKEMEVAKVAAGKSDTEANNRKSAQNDRDKTIGLSGRSASVLEVNPEFSFVLLNVGRANGLKTDSKLMVQRNGVHIANLKIVALENNRTVADIELKTARAGYQVMPGDRVVIETSVQ